MRASVYLSTKCKDNPPGINEGSENCAPAPKKARGHTALAQPPNDNLARPVFEHSLNFPRYTIPSHDWGNSREILASRPTPLQGHTHSLLASRAMEISLGMRPFSLEIAPLFTKHQSSIGIPELNFYFALLPEDLTCLLR